MVWPYWKNQARKDTENLLHSTTPGRSRERRCASKTNSWVHYGRWRLGEQIAAETGKNIVIKWQSQEEEEVISSETVKMTTEVS